MNRLKGQITEINTFEDLTLLNIDIANTDVKSIIIDDSKESQFLVGKTVDVLFKETELIISKNKTDLISLQNQFECTITALNKGKLLSQISLDFMRLSLYFSTGYILIWPLIFGSVSLFSESITRFFFVLLHLVFLFFYISKFSNLNPYIFNSWI